MRAQGTATSLTIMESARGMQLCAPLHFVVQRMQLKQPRACRSITVLWYVASACSSVLL